MTKHRKPEDFIKVPQYKGGNKALKDFIAKNLVYPEEALEAQISGTVELEFFLNSKGEVVDARVLKGIGHGCDEEALRLVRSLVYEKANNRGLRTTTRRTIKINFVLPKRQPQPKTTVYQYNIVKAKENTQKPAIKKPVNYQITIAYTPKK